MHIERPSKLGHSDASGHGFAYGFVALPLCTLGVHLSQFHLVDDSALLVFRHSLAHILILVFPACLGRLRGLHAGPADSNGAHSEELSSKDEFRISERLEAAFDLGDG